MIKLPVTQISEFISQHFNNYWRVSVSSTDILMPHLVLCINFPGNSEVPYKYSMWLTNMVNYLKDNGVGINSVRSYIYAFDAINMRLVGNPIVVEGLIGQVLTYRWSSEKDFTYTHWCSKTGSTEVSDVYLDESPFYVKLPRDPYDEQMNMLLNLYSNCTRRSKNDSHRPGRKYLSIDGAHKFTNIRDLLRYELHNRYPIELNNNNP